VVIQKYRDHLFRSLRFYYNHEVDTSAGGMLVTKGIILPVDSVSVLTWFIRYRCIYYWNLQIPKFY